MVMSGGAKPGPAKFEQNTPKVRQPGLTPLLHTLCRMIYQLCGDVNTPLGDKAMRCVIAICDADGTIVCHKRRIIRMEIRR